MTTRQICFLALLVSISTALAAPRAMAKSALDVTVCEFTVVEEIPHDRKAFTQGLTSAAGRLFESTGLYGQSGIREVDPDSGKLIRQRSLDDDLFGEGATWFNDKLYQVTWKSGRGFVYDPEDFNLLDTFTYSGEGWGLTHDGEHLILSDGTPQLRFLDPVSFTVKNTVTVTNDGREIANINELEYINGYIWANIWQTPWIAKISPQTGRVNAWVDLTAIAQPFQNDGVANGIVWVADSHTFIVTGKNWPAMFAILPDCL